MSEFRKIITEAEVTSGNLSWNEDQDVDFRRVIPETLVFDLVWDGKRLDHLSVDWDNRRVYVGELLMETLTGSEIILTQGSDRSGTTVQVKVQVPGQKIAVRKRLSSSEAKHRALKWYAREDELYRRLFPGEKAFPVLINGKLIPNRLPDFDNRQLLIGDAIRVFAPGDSLLIHRDPSAQNPTLVIEKETVATNTAADAMTSLRALITRLISRPLSEFNEGEVKGLIALLDENKKLWERIMTLKEENSNLKEQVATLENIFDHFSRNAFFQFRSEFEDWVCSHMGVIEKGVRVLHRDYRVELENGRNRRIDVLCQDRKGVLLAVEVVYNPGVEDIRTTVEMLTWLKQNIGSLGKALTGGVLQAATIRGMVVANHERPELVELCLQNGLKLWVVNGGFVVDVLE